MTRPEGIDRLLALDEIRELPLRYSSAVENRDVDAMATLFSPNSRFGRWGDGASGIRALMSETMGSSVLAVILVANHWIEFDDEDHAHGQVWARSYAQNDPGPFIEQVIKYEDTYERLAGRWLFVHRRHRLWFGSTVDQSPLEQAPAEWPASQVGVGDVPLGDPTFRSWYERIRARPRS